MRPDVSIIIPARNEASNIVRCLTAVFGQKTERDFEVILIDSGSTDGTAEVAARWPVKIIKIRAQDFDHGRTRNMGFEAATGEYLVAIVADAVPADGWLDELIAPLERDPDIAGSYSRQVPPADAHPLSSIRFDPLWPASAARPEPEVRSWPGEDVWENMDPMEKLRLVEFDDVSSARRRSVWERIPVAENYWAEDVDWSLKALRAGFKTAYASSSVVQHGHAPSVRHDFKRAFVDQREAYRRFGIVLYANVREAFGSWMRVTAQDARILKRSDLPIFEKIYWVAISPLRRLLEVLGGYIAGISIESDVVRDLYAGYLCTKRSGDLRKTVFSLGGRRCNTVFAHPPAKWSWKVSVGPGAKLKFLAGIDAEVHEKTAPVTFRVMVGGLTAWETVLDPAGRPEDRRWRPGEVDLGQWEGQRIKVDMITRTENIQNAWAGWGEPRVTANKGSLIHYVKKRLFELVERVLTRTPPRHP